MKMITHSKNSMSKVKSKKSKKKGQGLVEYIILIGLIALTVFVVVKTLGGNIQSKFKSMGSSISSMGKGTSN